MTKNFVRHTETTKGARYGQLSVLLLTYIITQSDHRLCAVEPWVQTHRTILELTRGWSIGEKDTTDDRLARVVEELGKQSEARLEIEVKLGRHLIRASRKLAHKVENVLERYRY